MSIRQTFGSVRGERDVVNQTNIWKCSRRKGRRHSDEHLEVFEEKEPLSIRRTFGSVRGERAIVNQTNIWKCSRRKSRSDEHLEVFEEKEPSSVRRTVRTVSRATLGKVVRDGMERLIMGFSERIDDILD